MKILPVEQRAGFFFVCYWTSFVHLSHEQNYVALYRGKV
jgi:hypothetical protein